jgi:hypothetical protein
MQNEIWVIVETWGQEIAEVSLELLSEASRSCSLTDMERILLTQ